MLLLSMMDPDSDTSLTQAILSDRTLGGKVSGLGVTSLTGFGVHQDAWGQGAYLGAVLRGHFRYYGVPMNGPALSVFRLAVGWIWCRSLRRRGQRRRINWLRMRGLISRLLPSPRICHPYPLVRLGVATQGGSRMR